MIVPASLRFDVLRLKMTLGIAIKPFAPFAQVDGAHRWISLLPICMVDYGPESNEPNGCISLEFLGASVYFKVGWK